MNPWRTMPHELEGINRPFRRLSRKWGYPCTWNNRTTGCSYNIRSGTSDTKSNEAPPPRGSDMGGGVGMDAADKSAGYMAVGCGLDTCSSTTESWGSDTCSSSCDSEASIVVPVVSDSSTTSPSTDVSEGNRARRSRVRNFRKM